MAAIPTSCSRPWSACSTRSTVAETPCIAPGFTPRSARLSINSARACTRRSPSSRLKIPATTAATYSPRLWPSTTEGSIPQLRHNSDRSVLQRKQRRLRMTRLLEAVAAAVQHCFQRLARLLLPRPPRNAPPLLGTPASSPTAPGPSPHTGFPGLYIKNRCDHSSLAAWQDQRRRQVPSSCRRYPRP